MQSRPDHCGEDRGDHRWAVTLLPLSQDTLTKHLRKKGTVQSLAAAGHIISTIRKQWMHGTAQLPFPFMESRPLPWKAPIWACLPTFPRGPSPWGVKRTINLSANLHMEEGAGQIMSRESGVSQVGRIFSESYLIWPQQTRMTAKGETRLGWAEGQEGKPQKQMWFAYLKIPSFQNKLEKKYK